MDNESGYQQRRPRGKRGTITTRPTRESIVRAYAAEDAARARGARMHSQAAAQHYQESSLRAKERASQREMLEAMRKEEELMRAAERASQRERQAADARSNASRYAREHEDQPRAARPSRVVEPLTTQQSHERAVTSRQSYERARQSRDILMAGSMPRTSNREVIDARGSIDSRAFNEHNELVGYSIDDDDRPRPAVDASNPKAKWHSHAGQGFGASSTPSYRARNRRNNLESLSDTISGRSSYTSKQGFWASLPTFAKVVIPLVIVLFVILMVILFL